MEKKLLLLGLLRMQEMHGYQLNELIDSHLGTSVHLKKPTAYRLLNQMTDDEWITFREEREGNRPPRRVYTITPNGEAAFQRLLRKSLADYKPVDFVGNIGLLFLDAVPAEETTSLLQNRRAIVGSLLQKVQTHEESHGSFQLMLEHQKRHLATELEWLDEVITRIESS
ncbi:MAG: PadR family transcriptional regulator [Chloroflexi bacterium]|nr:PadR family transcriptional regulator [Chloroflexota bacterium]